MKWNRKAPIVGNEKLQTCSQVHKADVALTARTIVLSQIRVKRRAVISVKLTFLIRMKRTAVMNVKLESLIGVKGGAIMSVKLASLIKLKATVSH